MIKYYEKEIDTLGLNKRKESWKTKMSLSVEWRERDKEF